MENKRKIDISKGSENIPIHLEDDTNRECLNNFNYVCCNIPGPGTETTDFEEQMVGCSCPEMSCGTKCLCMKYGPSYDSDGKLRETISDKELIVLNECNSSCTCSESCNNRVVQHGIKHRLEVFDLEDKGFCLRTLEPIECGEFVCEYAGEILTREEAKIRFNKQGTNDMNYIFMLNEHFTSGVHTTFIDPRENGNVGRFISHSCDPNLSVYPVRVHNLVPKVCLFASRDISANEELTYSYGHSYPGIADMNRKICKCNSENCRGFLPFNLSVLK